MIGGNMTNFGPTNPFVADDKNTGLRIASALERIADALEHLRIEKIDHNHIESDMPVEVNTHAKTPW